MLGEGALTFREFVMSEPLPLATLHDAVLEFLRGRDDAVLFGAQAVNAYAAEPRMTQDVDVISTRARELVEEVREHLASRFRIAVRVREVADGAGYWIYPVRQPQNRHLVDIRPSANLPPADRIGGILVVTVPELVAGKVIAFHARKGRLKSGTDWRDLAVLLLAHPELKARAGPVRDRLLAGGAAPEVLALWDELVDQEILPEEDEEL
jgi:hypothetical protein